MLTFDLEMSEKLHLYFLFLNLSFFKYCSRNGGGGEITQAKYCCIPTLLPLFSSVLLVKFAQTYSLKTPKFPLIFESFANSLQKVKPHA